MSPESLLYVMTAFVAVAALALLVQMFLLLGVYRSTKQLRERVETFLPRAEELIQTAQRTVEDTRKEVSEVVGKANQSLDLANRQLVRLDDVLADVTTRAKAQMDRAELILDDAMTRVQETVAVLHSGVLRPLREVNGVVSGFRAAFGRLVQGGRPTVAEATHDDEMFI
ncbi:MAG: hypothetical protein NTY38_21450 [Acidobacteria bacterium]|nr:hypothetical protein [Acidobacteriota bacterium]